MLPEAMPVLLLAVSSPGATLRPDDSRVAAIVETIDFIYTDNFEQAYRTAERINDTLPGMPVYNLMMASILQSRMTDLEDYSEKDRFFSLLDGCKGFFQDWIEDNPGDPWGHYFLGMVHAAKAMWHGQQKSWLKSFIEGLKARNKFSKAIELDPGLYDAYAGLGNYHFWSSAMLARYLPFVPDNRERGLQELRLAMDSSYFSSEPAATGLAWALIHEKKFAEARQIGLELYKKTSGGRISLWVLGSVSWQSGDLVNAGRYYGRLIDSLNREGGGNKYNLIFCRYRRGVSFYNRKEYERAKEDFEILLSYDVSKAIRSRHKMTYEKARDYLKHAEEELRRER
jgi:tetratricopeptide (TPR) repeat protein